MSVKIIYKYFPDLSEIQKQQLEQLQELYNHWNTKINVVSRKDIDQLYLRHVLHSLSVVKFIPFTSDSEIMDAGTGGGFPGIPLAILFPDCRFHCVDSIGKKITVVKEVASAMGLENLSAEHQRMEKVDGTYDFVVSRAVAPSKKMYQWVHQKIKKEHKNSIENGLILLKGGDLTNEMEELGRGYIEKSLTEVFDEAFFETKKIVYVPV